MDLSFDDTIGVAETPYVRDNLPVGEWTVTVDGINADEEKKTIASKTVVLPSQKMIAMISHPFWKQDITH